MYWMAMLLVWWWMMTCWDGVAWSPGELPSSSAACLWSSGVPGGPSISSRLFSVTAWLRGSGA